MREKKYNGRVAAMVSGGIDSMVMLDKLLAAGNDVVVVHVNHLIRPEAASDCAFVRRFCLERGVPFLCRTFDIPALAAQSGRSIETEARLARRKTASELLATTARQVAFAHHMDDNAETVLMHILRGSGVDGLVGIRETGGFVRPLIGMTRAEIASYAAEHSVPHIEDATNTDPSYTRNFVRLELLPLIETRYPGATKALCRLANNAEELITAVDDNLDMSLITEEGSIVCLDIRALGSDFASRYVTLAAKRLMPVDITSAHIYNVLMLAKARNGSVAELANGMKAFREYDKIVFCMPHPHVDAVEPFREGSVPVGTRTVKVTKVEPKPIRGKTVVSSVPSGAVFRFRRAGDRFTPFGGGERSLREYLIDRKIPIRLRDDLVCLCDENAVLAIVSLEISSKCRITPSSEYAYLLEYDD